MMKRICPLRENSWVQDILNPSRIPIQKECAEEECAWWSKIAGECAILTIALKEFPDPGAKASATQVIDDVPVTLTAGAVGTAWNGIEVVFGIVEGETATAVFEDGVLSVDLVALAEYDEDALNLLLDATSIIGDDTLVAAFTGDLTTEDLDGAEFVLAGGRNATKKTAEAGGNEVVEE